MRFFNQIPDLSSLVVLRFENHRISLGRVLKDNAAAGNTPPETAAEATPGAELENRIAPDDLAANLRAALAAGEVPTDEAAAMERAGVRPLLVPGSLTNIKITGSGDLGMAEYILRQQLLQD